MKIKPIKRLRLFVQVSEQIEQFMATGEYKPGDKFPPEQKLAERFGVSRNVLREAYRSLAERGLITVKHGRGVFVKKPELSVVSNALKRIIQTEDKESSLKLYEVRLIIESTNVFLATLRNDNKDLMAMERAIDKMNKIMAAGITTDRLAQWAKADFQFHMALAQATHNQFFSMLLQPLTSAVINTIVVLLQKKPDFKNDVKNGIADHWRIFENIKESNLVGAVEAMNTHLERFKRIILEN